MRVLVDGRSFCKYAAGITTFLQCALSEWARQRFEDTFYLLLPKHIDDKVDIDTLPKNIKFINLNSLVFSILPNILLLQFMVPVLSRKLHVDIYFSPVPHLPFLLPNRTKSIIVVHDVVNIEFRQTMSFTNRMASTFFFSYAVKNADILWYNSNYTRSRIARYFPKRNCKKELVGDSSDETFYNSQAPDTSILDNLKASYGFDDNYVLFVGSLEPRKNLPFLISIAPSLYTEYGLKLVVVGANKWKSSEIWSIVKSEGFKRDAVIFCEYVSNMELTALYHGARCFVSASFNEGFGMPQLEALKCGCPIVTANNSAMAELAKGKDGAMTVDGYNRDEWIKSIAETARMRPKVDANQLAEYNWKKIIDRLIHCLQKDSYGK